MDRGCHRCSSGSSDVVILQGRESAVIGLGGLVPSLGGAISGLLLVSMGQITRAAVDSADHTGEMLAIMKANNK